MNELTTNVLEKLITKYRKEYYEDDNPSIDDDDYDRIVNRLKVLDPNNKLLSKVGGKPSNLFQKYKHPTPMLSLANTFNKQEVVDTIHGILKKVRNKCTFTIENKLDGLSLELIYDKNGNLDKAVTRGDGVVGELVTENAKMIENVPLHVDRRNVEIRGEVIMPRKAFEEVNQMLVANNKKKLANPRNAAAGALRQLDTNKVKERKLFFVPYFITEYGTDSHNKDISLLKDLGFDISYLNHQLVVSKDPYSVIDDVYTTTMSDRDKLPVDIDGLVVKVVEKGLYDVIGSTYSSPKWAFAIKFPSVIVQTRLLNVVFQIGRTGIITPVAKISPVVINGAMISSVTLHNKDELDRLDLHQNDEVLVKRSGDVIPKIIGVVKELRTSKEKVKYPTICPCCATPLVSNTDGVLLRCPNELCVAVRIESLRYFVSKECLDISGLGIMYIEKLMSHNIITNAVDIFDITVDDLLKLPNVKNKLANKIVNAVNKARHVKYSRFIVALGIPGISIGFAEKLMVRYPKAEMLVDAKYEDIIRIDGIGEILASNIVEYFAKKEVVDYFYKLLSVLYILYEEVKVVDVNNKFYNKKVCITGSFNGYNREQLVNLIKENGGTVVSSVSKKTDILLAGENTGSKFAVAEALGINIITII